MGFALFFDWVLGAETQHKAYEPMDKVTVSCDKMTTYNPTVCLVFWNAFPSLGLLVFTTCTENICR